ncbi:MAG: hypothetical protein OSB69_19285 [Alphaproteobacteria bacterium]|nr:hypothetical protein [Alphaproteobacteria bacterium]
MTFLFTDIERSARHWDQSAEPIRQGLGMHGRLLYQVSQDYGGWEFKHTGDGVIAASTPQAIVEAATAAQRDLTLPPRLGVSTGEVAARDDDYFSPAFNHEDWAISAGHGGQIFVTNATLSIAGPLSWLRWTVRAGIPDLRFC